MGELKVKVSDKTESKFREAAMKKYGYGKGSLSLAAEKAFSEWSLSAEKIKKFAEGINDPILAIKGMLSPERLSSVELRHKGGEIRSKRYASH